MIKEGLLAALERKARPKHVGIPRRRVELPFAVEMMRSTYNAIDWLDCTAMDEFQRTFFLFRQNEWEDYRKYHPNVFQGDLSDPLYFDFISFAQYATAAEKFRTSRTEFVEKFNAQGDTRIVRRSPKLQNNDILPIIHSRAVGQRLVEWMYVRYNALLPSLPDKSVALIAEARLDKELDGFRAGAQALLDVFTINSFAADAQISEVPFEKTAAVTSGSRLYRIVMRAPATLWSQQVLRVRKDLPVNDFEVKCLQEYARRCGLELTRVLTSIENGIDVVHLVRLTPAVEVYVPLDLWKDENFEPVKGASFQVQDPTGKGNEKSE